MRRIIVFWAALLLLAPTAWSQNPTEPSVDVTITAVDADVSIDEHATYTVTVENTSPGTGNEDAPTMAVTLSVSGAPEGWRATLERTAFQIPPGGEEETTLTVSVTGSAEEDSATITVEATISNGGIGPLEATATDSDDVEILRDDSTKREVAEAVADYLWVIVVGGILLYIISTALLIMLFRKRVQERGQDEAGADPDPPAATKAKKTKTQGQKKS